MARQDKALHCTAAKDRQTDRQMDRQAKTLKLKKLKHSNESISIPVEKEKPFSALPFFS